MDYLHSAQTGRFYRTGEDGLPDDARLLDADRGAQFWHVQSRADAARQSGNDALATSLEVTAEAIEAAVITAARAAEQHRAGRREWRNAKLLESDWTQLPDAFGGDDARRASWATYRQVLRDLDLDGDDVPEIPA